MGRGKRKMNAEEYEQDRIARRRVSGPPIREGLRRLGPVTPVQRQTGEVRVRQLDTPRLRSGGGVRVRQLDTPRFEFGPSMTSSLDPNVPEDGGYQDGVEEDHLQTPNWDSGKVYEPRYTCSGNEYNSGSPLPS